MGCDRCGSELSTGSCKKFCNISFVQLETSAVHYTHCVIIIAQNIWVGFIACIWSYKSSVHRHSVQIQCGGWDPAMFHS